MGTLSYFVNHDKKVYFCPDASKWSEIVNNKDLMADILDFIRNMWNNCRIEITTGYDLEKLRSLGYQEIEFEW